VSTESIQIKTSNQFWASNQSNLSTLSTRCNQSNQWIESREYKVHNKSKESSKHLIIGINKKNLGNLMSMMNAINQKILKKQSINVKTLIDLIYLKSDDLNDLRNLINIQIVINIINQKCQSNLIHGIHMINQKK